VPEYSVVWSQAPGCGVRRAVLIDDRALPGEEHCSRDRSLANPCDQHEAEPRLHNPPPKKREVAPWLNWDAKPPPCGRVERVEHPGKLFFPLRLRNYDAAPFRVADSVTDPLWLNAAVHGLRIGVELKRVSDPYVERER
jgi:hypothetical protein